MPFGLPSLNPGASAPAPDKGQSTISLAWLDSGGAVNWVRFDVVTNESHEAVMQLTDHAVELGANVVDNARELPQTITIEGYISNAPLMSNPGMSKLVEVKTVDLAVPKVPLKPSLSSVASAIGDLISPPSNKATVQAAKGDFPDRVRDFYETLRDAQTGRSLVRIVTPVEDVDGMLIERIGVTRTTSEGTGATFNVELRKVRLVSSESVDAPAPTELRGKLAEAKGSKGTSKASDAHNAKGASLLAQGADGAAALLQQLGL